MDLQDLLSNPDVVGQLARSAGVGDRDARTGIGALLPAITRGLQRNAGGSNGLENLVKALGTGAHSRYLDSPELLGESKTRLDGNSILGHVFGSKDVSRNVAGHAAQSSGLDAELLKKMLPLVASLAMGALSRETRNGTTLQPQASSSSGAGADLLGSILGGLMGGGSAPAANDSPFDDVLDLAKKFL